MKGEWFGRSRHFANCCGDKELDVCPRAPFSSGQALQKEDQTSKSADNHYVLPRESTNTQRGKATKEKRLATSLLHRCNNTGRCAVPVPIFLFAHFTKGKGFQKTQQSDKSERQEGALCMCMLSSTSRRSSRNVLARE